MKLFYEFLLNLEFGRHESGGTRAPTSLQGGRRGAKENSWPKLLISYPFFFFVFKYEMKHSTSLHWSYSDRNLAPIFRPMTPTWSYQRFGEKTWKYLICTSNYGGGKPYSYPTANPKTWLNSNWLLSTALSRFMLTAKIPTQRLDGNLEHWLKAG